MSEYGHLTSWISDEDARISSFFFSNPPWNNHFPPIINQSDNTNCQNLDFHHQPAGVAAACHPDRTSFHRNPKRLILDNSSSSSHPPDTIAVMKERMYRAAVFRPVDFTVDKPKRKNVRMSNDPQTAAARHRRERISERIRILQPGGSKMDTASMLDEAANYLKFLRAQVRELEAAAFGLTVHDQMLGGNLNLGFSPTDSSIQSYNNLVSSNNYKCIL